MSTNPFRYFKTSLEIIRLAVMQYIRSPLSLHNVEDLLHERGIVSPHSQRVQAVMEIGRRKHLASDLVRNR